MKRTAWARWRRPVLILLGAGAVVYLAYQVGLGAVWDSIHTLGWRLLIVIVVPHSIAAILDTIGWGLLLESRVPALVLTRARLAGETVNLTTPTASVGGEPLKAYLLRPHVPMSEGLASVVADKTAVVVSQVGFLACGLALALHLLPAGHPLMISMSALLAIEIVAVGGFLLVQTRGVFGGGGRTLGRLGVGPAVKYQEGLNALDLWLRRFYRERRARLLGASLLHGAAWAIGGLEIYLVLTLLGTPTSMVAALVIEAFGAAIKFASFMIPGSLGALEGGFVAIFTAFGQSAATGLSYALIRRVREAVWSGATLLWLASLRARTDLMEPDSRTSDNVS